MEALEKAERQSSSERPLSIRAFAEAAGTSPRRIRRLIRQGRLRTVQNKAGQVRIPESELKRIIDLKKNKLLQQSMELQAVPDTKVSNTAPKAIEMIEPGPAVPLPRHEAAMVRLGFLESELATTRKLLIEATSRERELQQKLEASEKEAVSATVRAIEAEHNLQELRTQVVDSTFRAMELEEEVKKLREQLMSPWWVRLAALFKGKRPHLEDASPSSSVDNQDAK